MKARLLSLLLLLTACTPRPVPPAVQPWTMVADGQGGIWRMDVETGAIQHCHAETADLRIQCSVGPAPSSAVLLP